MKAIIIGMVGLMMSALQCCADSKPYLFIDDYLIAKSTGLVRNVNQPSKLPEPVLDNKTFGVTQPYITVLKDDESGMLRMWYCKSTQLWCVTSKDGMHWSDAKVSYARPRGYGASIIDDKGRDPDPARRFKLADWESTPELDDTPRDNGGMYITFSPDNVNWTRVPGNPILPTWPEGYNKLIYHGVSDIIDAYYDPIHKRYAAAVKLIGGLPEDYPWSRGLKMGSCPGTRRLVGMTFSNDFVTWEKPWRIICPGENSEGQTEFYSMGGIHARGDLLIGFVRVLRDDLPCDEDGPIEGIGYTTLAWSLDGRNWTWDHETFINRNLKSGSWDHAMTWAGSTIQIGDELFIYYGGYARGHKIEPKTERQIGLARMPVDRYVSRDAGHSGGTLLTRPIKLQGKTLTVNADIKGEMRARLLGNDGKPVRGYDWNDCKPIHGDSLAHTVHWKGAGKTLPSRPVRLEFRLTDAMLFAFSTADGS